MRAAGRRWIKAEGAGRPGGRIFACPACLTIYAGFQPSCAPSPPATCADAARAFHESLYRQKLASLLEKKKLSEEDDKALREMQVGGRALGC